MHVTDKEISFCFIGLLLFLTSENASCREHLKLETIRKEIIRDEHDRRRCKTEFTMSIQNQYCARIVRFICKRKSYYFQGNMIYHYISKRKYLRNNHVVYKMLINDDRMILFIFPTVSNYRM